MTKTTLARTSRVTNNKMRMMVSGALVFVGIAGITLATSVNFHRANAESGYPKLTATFNNVGTSDNANTKLANFDGAGASYSRQDLAAKGWTPGASISYAGSQLSWPQTTAGQPDNVIAAGQTITLEGQGPSLTFLTAANNGNSTGTGTIIYNDGTSSNYSLTAPDWATGPVAQNIINLARRNRANTTQLTAATQLFPVSIPLDQAKTVAFVKLPMTTGGRMHVFAMDIRERNNDWTASWGASTERVTVGATWKNQTLRQVVHSSIGGDKIRLRFENSYNPSPTKLGHVTVALQQNGKTPYAVPVTVTFNGSQSVTMPAGSDVVSDPLNFNLPAHTRMLVSTYFPDGVAAYSWHTIGMQTNYSTAAGAGDRTADMGNFPSASTFNYSTFIAGVDVESDAGTVVAFGDSITDGPGSLANSDTTYPANLGYRLGDTRGVVNAGIGGNQVLKDSTVVTGNYAAVSRFYRDAIAIPGVKSIILLEGTNDIANNASAANVQAGLKYMVDRAKSYGIKVYIGTMIPFGGANGATTAFDTTRKTVNTWIRSGASGANGVIDFDAAVGLAGSPAKIQPIYDAGDHAHPNTAGNQMLAKVVDLSVL